MTPSQAPVAPSPAQLLLAAAAYLLAQLLIRLGAPHGLELDEAEQLLLAQWLQGGYSPQPPLYTWVQILADRTLGPGVLSLALPRALLLFAFFACILEAARRDLRDDRLAGLAALSFLFVAQVVWELQRENTHSLLVLTLAAAQYLVIQGLLERPTLAGYLLAGVVAGLGMLAKYNFGVFLAAVGLALLTTPGGRALVFDRRLIPALAVAVLVMTPHLFWLADHAQTVAGSLEDKLDARAGSGALLALGRLAVTLVSYLTPLWLVYLVFFPGAWRRLATGSPAVATRFPLAPYFALVLVFLLLLTLGMDADRFRERWMHPLLFLFPIWFLAHVDPAALTVRRERAFRIAAAAVAGVMLAVMGFRSFVAPVTGPHSRIDQPLDRVAAEIRATGLPTDRIVAGHYHLAGSLRLHFPGSRVYAPRDDLVLPAPGPGPVLLVWDAARTDAMPDILDAYLARHGLVPSRTGGAPIHVEVPYAGSPGGRYRLALLPLP